MNQMHRFECTLCGDCCSGNQTIRLNGEDINLISAFLKKTAWELFESSFLGLIREENGFLRPILGFKSVRVKNRRLRFCPFLQNSLGEDHQLRGLCQLHPDFKPLVCALSPWARELDFALAEERWLFVAPVEDCPGVGLGEPVPRDVFTAGLKSRLAREKLWFERWESFQSRQTGRNPVDFFL